MNLNSVNWGWTFGKFGVADGARTHDNRNHNPGLYQLSYSHHWKNYETKHLKLKFGLPDRNRTCNPQLRRLVLYPVELRADGYTFETQTSFTNLKVLYKRFKQRPLYFTAKVYGRRGEIRTPDILLPKQARYQATLHAEEAEI